ncbi:MAG TPA: hypothetical protein VMJ30_06010 [Gemmatimonadales bacterium]|nr:hypothetical protein [Gemmatimonadales bacterium]
MSAEHLFNFGIYSGLSALALFALMLVCQELGHRMAMGKRSHGTQISQGLAVVESAAFGLLALLLAFTFASAASRFELRRQQITEEANDIGTAWLRIDLLTAEAQPEMRNLFRQYVDARIAAFASLPDLAAFQREVDRAVGLQAPIWSGAVAATSGQGAPQMLVLPALNQMFDMANTRTMSTRVHQPEAIFFLLVLLSLACAFLAGYGMADPAGRDWVHLIGFAAAIAVSVYIVYDLEYPRAGLIRLGDMDHVMISLRASMH